MAAEGSCDAGGDSLVHQPASLISAELEPSPDPALQLPVDPGPVDLAIPAPRPAPTTPPKPVPKPKPTSIPRNIPQMIPTANPYGLAATQMLPSQLRMMALAVSRRS